MGSGEWGVTAGGSRCDNLAKGSNNRAATLEWVSFELRRLTFNSKLSPAPLLPSSLSKDSGLLALLASASPKFSLLVAQ